MQRTKKREFKSVKKVFKEVKQKDTQKVKK